MGHVASTDFSHPDLTSTEHSSRGGILEALGSVSAIVLVVALAVNWFGAHLTFFGDPVVIDDEDVRHYWVIVGLLATGQLATWVGAARRGAQGAWVWHALVAVVGLAAALLFAVTTAGPVDGHHEPGPAQPSYTGPRCYSGGDSSECPGG
jgi:Family of unknown function (DUF6234)